MGNRYKFTADVSVKNRSVTGSRIMISVHRQEGDIKFLVDCGIYQGEEDYEEKNYAKFDFNPENLDFVLLTHIHADHSALIPLLFKRGFYQKVYCSEDTAYLARIALNDDAKIMEMNAKHHDNKPLYGFGDVERALSQIVSKEFEETFEPCDGVKVTFFKNAHLIGAVVILVQISSYGEKDINLLFMGDFNKKNMFFEVNELPEWVKKLDLHVICESTYGNVDSSSTNAPVFCNNIANWLENGKKTIVVLAISLGRHQEISYMLKTMQEKGIIPPSVKIWLDGNLGIQYTKAYLNGLHISESMKNFLPENSEFVSNRDDVYKQEEQQKIIVTTSGGGNFGPAPEYLERYIERKDSGVHFTSFLWEESLGRRLLNTEQGNSVTVGAILKSKIADVKTTSEFSGHAKRDELLSFLSNLTSIKSLHIVHGEPEVKESFGEYCREHLGLQDNVSIGGLGYTTRINPFGIVKSIRDKPMIII